MIKPRVAFADRFPTRSNAKTGWRKPLIAVGLILAVLATRSITPAHAQGIALIRDAEIETHLREFVTPYMKTGGLDPEALKLYIVNDNSLNAFVTRGNRMFFHTGLLLAAENSGQVLGVVAHEVGHLAAGDALNVADNVTAATRTMLLTTLLGVAAGVASGNADVGAAMVMGGQGAAQRVYLSYNRGQEAAADEFALKALEEQGQSATGLYQFFSRLFGQELLITTRQDPYVRSHPLTLSRMQRVQTHVEHEAPGAFVISDPEKDAALKRMQAKIFGFLKPFPTTLERYPETDRSIEGRYARSIAYYRKGLLDKAVDEVDSLLEEEPENGYFLELKAQMLFEHGRIADSVPIYRQSAAALDDHPLILTALAHALVESNDPSLNTEIQSVIQKVVKADGASPWAWDLSARAYTQAGNTAMANYAAAEKAYLMGDFQMVMRHVQRAERELADNSIVYNRLQDLKFATTSALQEMRNARR